MGPLCNLKCTNQCQKKEKESAEEDWLAKE